jgi:uncharacterized protein (DUF433 family)
VKAQPLVSSAAEAIENIERFSSTYGDSPAIQERVTRAHVWYAVRGDQGWAFGHSKFVGYRDNNPSQYLRMANDWDGGATEKRLREWFAPVDLDTPLGRELYEALRIFLASESRFPRQTVEICVLKSELDRASDSSVASRSLDRRLLARITADPGVCGGRPCIRGTRMRVSDIVDMIAAGATPAEIVADFPYVTEEDITAALAFAARAVDHRIIHAA